MEGPARNAGDLVLADETHVPDVVEGDIARKAFLLALQGTPSPSPSHSGICMSPSMFDPAHTALRTGGTSAAPAPAAGACAVFVLLSAPLGSQLHVCEWWAWPLLNTCDCRGSVSAAHGAWAWCFVVVLRALGRVSPCALLFALRSVCVPLVLSGSPCVTPWCSASLACVCAACGTVVTLLTCAFVHAGAASAATWCGRLRSRARGHGE